jgi:hypothetical protein
LVDRRLVARFLFVGWPGAYINVSFRAGENCGRGVRARPSLVRVTDSIGRDEQRFLQRAQVVCKKDSIADGVGFFR